MLDAVVGDVDEDGEDELVVAFRKPGRITPAQAVDPAWEWADDEGRTSHVGRYHLPTLEPIWVASTLARPVRALAACDGAIAVSYGPLDAVPAGTGAWRWGSFGFRPAVDLDGTATPACIDIDGDGRTEPGAALASAAAARRSRVCSMPARLCATRSDTPVASWAIGLKKPARWSTQPSVTRQPAGVGSNV